MAFLLAVVVGSALLTVFYFTVVRPKRGLIGEFANDLCACASYEDSLGAGDGALWIVLIIICAVIAALYGFFRYLGLP